jgi:hypothetical protein
MTADTSVRAYRPISTPLQWAWGAALILRLPPSSPCLSAPQRCAHGGCFHDVGKSRKNVRSGPTLRAEFLVPASKSASGCSQPTCYEQRRDPFWLQTGCSQQFAPSAMISVVIPRSLILDSRQRRLDGRRRGATRAGGKSGLRRAGCWLTARGGDPTAECHRKQTAARKDGKGETVR